MLKRYCDAQRERHGPDWKRIVAAELTKQTTPFIEALLNLRKR